MICVHDATVSITPTPTTPPLSLTTVVSTVPSMFQNKAKINNLNILTETDLNSWINNYTSAYVSPPHTTPGMVMGNSALSTINRLSTKVRVNNEFVVLMTTIINMSLNVTTPAVIPIPPPGSPTPDPSIMYSATVTFTNANQNVVLAL